MCYNSYSHLTPLIIVYFDQMHIVLQVIFTAQLQN